MKPIFNYVERSSPVHALTGATKLCCLLLWSFAAMTTYDTRLLAVLAAAGVAVFAASKLRISDISFLLGFVTVFMILNNVLVFVFSPEHGVGLYGTRHVLFSLGGRWIVTKEQLFYHLNLVLKYLAMLPVVMIFICTTQPSEFAASLNRIGLPTIVPKGAFYMFPSIRPTGMTSEEFAISLLRGHGVACVPGIAFGKCGEGFVRMSYATSMDKLAVAVRRIGEMLS